MLPRARLPGIRFETAAPPPADVLPRMDVAAFVGFAAAGPVHVPVPVEDPAAFADVFGADARLAWDPERGAYQAAYLGPAVRAFFRNGGRRCWVIRTAGPTSANAFAVPGVKAVGADGTLRPAVARARSGGSWSDGVRVSTALVVEQMRAARIDVVQQYWVPAGPAPADIRTGDLIRLVYPDGGYLYVPVSEVGSVKDPTASPPNELRVARWDQEVWIAGPGSPPAAPAGNPVRVERVTFELWVRRDGERLRRLGGLGFVPGHPRFWGALPTDALLYGDDEPPARHAALWADAASPRFALAGGEAGLTLPVDMPVLPVEYVGPDIPARTPLERDGLAAYGPGLFLGADDPAALRPLVEASAGRLLAEADYIRWGGPDPRPLRGVFAALGVDEATLIACPDAVHRGWDWVATPTIDESVASPPAVPPGAIGFAPCETEKGPTPTLAAGPPDADGNFTLSWGGLSDADLRYTLEEAAGAAFVGPAELFRGIGTTLDVRGRRPGVYWFRVRGDLDGGPTAWSDLVSVRVVSPARWQVRPAGAYTPDVLFAVHRALLRVCAARGDLMAVLAMPEHYREGAAADHAAELTSPVGRVFDVAVSPGSGVRSVPLNPGEAVALSFGAVYHPWLLGREETGPDAVRRVPPDGAACGIMAKRAVARGPWVAPANERLRGVVGLAPDIPADSRLGLQEARVNLIRPEPRGFLALAADTLSPTDDLREINVRRLLILLRRLALRVGADYAFEPNTPAFRRSVRRGFEESLGFLFSRGAFAGRFPAEAFRVVVDDTVNPPGGVEQGRFVVELRVAPSRPLAFLTVRLVQAGERGTVTEVG